MTGKPLVSIVIPVYNVAAYLEECVRSVFSQTYRNIEVVIVDDGSTDGSGALCDRLALEDGRAVVFHKENGGLADARNYGLARCRGEWVSFVDSDDYVSPVFVEALLRAALSGRCEISAVPFGRPFKDGGPCYLAEELGSAEFPTVMESSCVQRLMLYQKLDTGAPWRLYRRELLGDDPFPKGLYYEDLASVYKIIHRVDAVAVLDCRNLYAYRMRSNSIIRQEYRHIKAESALTISRRLYSDICRWYPDLADAAASRCFSLCRMVFAQIPTGAEATPATKRDRNELWILLRNHRRTVLHDATARKRERLAALFACLGKPAFSAFCSFARRFGLMR